MLHFYMFKETDVFCYKIYHNFIKFVKTTDKKVSLVESDTM